MTTCSRNDFERPELALSYIANRNVDNSKIFIQISDTQLGIVETRLTEQFNAMSEFIKLLGLTDFFFGQEVKNYETIINFANKVDPEFLIICGDLIQARSPQQYKDEFQRISKSLKPGIPLFLVSGNHDVGEEPSELSLRYYRETYGDDWYSFKEGGIYGIVLNSSLIKEPDKAPLEAERQYQWLKQELTTAQSFKQMQIVVFQHHPYFVKDPNEEYSKYFNFDKEERKKYLELLVENGVKLVMAGHYHYNSVGFYKNLKIVTTSSSGFSNRLVSNTGFQVVQVKNNSINNAFVSMEDLPALGRKLEH